MKTKSKLGLKEIVLDATLIAGAALAAGTLGLPGCNPIDVYRTIEIRREEADMYKQYKQIDMNNLTVPEKNYLNEMHEKHGEEPIDASKLTDELSENWIKNFTYLTRHKKFTDKDLIFMHRTSGDLAGAVMSTMNQ